MYWKIVCAENLLTINRKTEFPDFTNIKDFPWLFPNLEKFSFFPDRSLTVATLLITLSYDKGIFIEKLIELAKISSHYI